MVMSADYKRYLASPEWAKKRREALLYYGEQCAVCGNDWRGRCFINVHHLHYRTIGFESVRSDLRLLCESHHPKGILSNDSIRRWRSSYVFWKITCGVFVTIGRIITWLALHVGRSFRAMLSRSFQTLRKHRRGP